MIKMTKEAVIELFNGLTLTSNLSGAKFSYAIARNIVKLKDEVLSIRKASESSKEFLEYEKARVSLAKKHSIKVNGVPKVDTVGGIKRYDIKDQVKFDVDFKKLKEKYKEVLDEKEKQEQDMLDILKEEVEIDLYLIPREYIPEEINTKQMTAILSIIKE